MRAAPFLVRERVDGIECRGAVCGWRLFLRASEVDGKAESVKPHEKAKLADAS